MRFQKQSSQPNFEDAISESTSSTDLVEIPLKDKTIGYLTASIFILAAIFLGRLIWLGIWMGDTYQARAEGNALKIEAKPAPRGIIYDRFGKPIVQNQPIFSAVLNLRTFLQSKELQQQTLAAIERILGMSSAETNAIIEEGIAIGAHDSVILARSLSQEQLIALKALALPTVNTVETFERKYAHNEAFSHVVGFV